MSDKVTSTLLEAALNYAAEGIPVFPLHSLTLAGVPPCSCANARCENVAKHPRTAHGFKDATRDESTIREWWQRWPEANIGIPTGEASGLVVLDIDSLETKDQLKQLVSFNGEPKVRTARGFHVYYAYDGRDFRNKAGVMPGLDFRGNGGYVVAPPSVHATNKTYTWQETITENNLQPIPPDLEKLLTASPQPQASDGLSERFNTAQALSGVPEGHRDETLFKLACKLRNADVPREMAETLILEAAKNCEPPFSERIALEKVERAYRRYEPKQENARPGADQDKKQSEIWPEFFTAKQILSLPPDTTRWVWDNTLPFGTGSAGVAKPKTGKTYTFANLSLAIARGVSFLGRNTTQCPVAYLSLDASLPEIAEIFIRLGLRESDPVFLHAGAAPRDAIAWVTQRIQENGVRFVVVDTLQRLFRFQNLNDYSEVTNTLEPMLEAVRQQNAHCLFVHHAKKDAGDDLDSAIGSTAIRGLCYTYLHLKRLPDSERRIIRSDQRGGKNMPEMAIGFNRLTGWLEIQGTIEEAEIDETVPKIRELLEVEAGNLTEKEIRRNIPHRGIIVSKAIKQMFTAGELERTGQGKKGDPFRYSLALTLNGHSPNSCPEVGGMGGETTGHESEKMSQPSEINKKDSCPGFLGHAGTRRDTNPKSDSSGHESEWEPVTR